MKKIRQTLSSLATNWSMTQKSYPRLPLEVGGLALLVFLVALLPIGFFLNWITAALVAVPAALLVATIWFSRRAMKAAYKQIDGEPGAAAAVLQSQRGNNWAVTPGVAVNRSQDLISRAVGKPGVVLISEGPSNRVVPMLAVERKKTARWLPDIPIYEMQVGTEEGQIRISRLQKEMGKLPKNLRPAESNDIRRRLDALSQRQNAIPLPKGPMPRQSR